MEVMCSHYKLMTCSPGPHWFFDWHLKGLLNSRHKYCKRGHIKWLPIVAAIVGVDFSAQKVSMCNFCSGRLLKNTFTTAPPNILFFIFNSRSEISSQGSQYVVVNQKLCPALLFEHWGWSIDLIAKAAINSQFPESLWCGGRWTGDFDQQRDSL